MPVRPLCQIRRLPVGNGKRPQRASLLHVRARRSRPAGCARKMLVCGHRRLSPAHRQRRGGAVLGAAPLHDERTSHRRQRSGVRRVWPAEAPQARIGAQVGHVRSPRFPAVIRVHEVIAGVEPAVVLQHGTSPHVSRECTGVRDPVDRAQGLVDGLDDDTPTSSSIHRSKMRHRNAHAREEPPGRRPRGEELEVRHPNSAKEIVHLSGSGCCAREARTGHYRRHRPRRDAKDRVTRAWVARPSR